MSLQNGNNCMGGQMQPMTNDAANQQINPNPEMHQPSQIQYHPHHMQYGGYSMAQQAPPPPQNQNQQFPGQQWYVQPHPSNQIMPESTQQQAQFQRPQMQQHYHQQPSYHHMEMNNSGGWATAQPPPQPPPPNQVSHTTQTNDKQSEIKALPIKADFHIESDDSRLEDDLESQDSDQEHKTTNRKPGKKRKTKTTKGGKSRGTKKDEARAKKVKPKTKKETPEGTIADEGVEEVRRHFEKGCECADQNCYEGLDPEAVYKHRLNIDELTKLEHDMYLMGVTMACLESPDETHRQKERKRLRSKYRVMVSNVSF